MPSLDRRTACVGDVGIDTLIGRHITETFLARYCSAMDARDAVAAGRLLSNADLYFKDLGHRRGRDDIEAFYTGLFEASTDDTAHLIGNLLVGVDDTTVFYSCAYQRVLIDARGPRLVAIGRYAGRIALIGIGASWLEHHVTTF